jgi:hypothetical protein
MQAESPEPYIVFPALTCLPVQSRFFARPQLLTRVSPFPWEGLSAFWLYNP